MTNIEKENAYQSALVDLEALLKSEHDLILKMASINSVLKYKFPYYFWVGFYLAKDDLLSVGPYQGTFGCLHIPFGKGVCGAAALQKKTEIVPDVHKFPGHISCDSHSESEIVVPVFNQAGKLIAVFDVDSDKKNSFNEIDQKYLEKILTKFFAGNE